MKFRVEDNETIEMCLKRMRDQGYTPVKRFEKPVFIEKENGEIEVLKQEIQFVGKKL
ncbi:NETI motif-containing protein [Mammaliicoccus sp. Dog046]|uniref:NETI motif-containing protein n=1 Tax=Mammaliicoccus sp. Dog046 TaxID=3034233 RepID=UPI002B25BF9E|nr:NETI motif-containing protein [Mammaliicoccus sp. Dog046]WQK86229.1 NETI motif-containing protein [Mammaliicoccus sp. Dog046]